MQLGQCGNSDQKFCWFNIDRGVSDNIVSILITFYLPSNLTFWHFTVVKTGNNSLLIAKNVKKSVNIAWNKEHFNF